MGQDGVPVFEEKVFVIITDTGIDEEDHGAQQRRQTGVVVEELFLYKGRCDQRPAGNGAPGLGENDPDERNSVHTRLVEIVKLHALHKADRDLKERNCAQKSIKDRFLCPFRLASIFGDVIKANDQGSAGDQGHNVQDAPLTAFIGIVNPTEQPL